MQSQQAGLKGVSPFVYRCGVETLTEDFSELRTCPDYINGTSQGGHDRGNYRVLEAYPKSEEILTVYVNKFLQGIYDGEFGITTSWITRLNKGDTITPHCHHNSLYSGILYYGDYDNDVCPLEFQNPITHTMRFCPEGADNPKGLAVHANWLIWPRHNLCALWPSQLTHSAKEHKSNVTRYSLAFNVVPKGHFGHYDSQLNAQWMN
tara:strand:- start:6551 stop:7168 length:618 start_codon:yes stop_codon:yes gene_type:complete